MAFRPTAVRSAAVRSPAFGLAAVRRDHGSGFADQFVVRRELALRGGDDAFIGSNTALVAPVTIGEGAVVGAGSVITEDVEPHSLAVERNQQKGIAGWAKRFRAAKAKKAAE